MAKFITITEGAGNSPKAINVDHIITMTPNNTKTIIIVTELQAGINANESMTKLLADIARL